MKEKVYCRTGGILKPAKPISKRQIVGRCVHYKAGNKCALNYGECEYQFKKEQS